MAHRIEEAAKTWKFIIIGCLCYLALIALFASERYVSGMLERERQLNYGVLGEGPAGHAESRAHTWYKASFVDSGLVVGSLRVVSDPDSAEYLEGLVIDYSDDLIRSGFRFTNPNASGCCGCGSSFET